MDLTSGGSLQLEQTGKTVIMSQNESSDPNVGNMCLFSAATCTLSHTTCHLYVDVALFCYAVTYNYVLWTEGVSEINYCI